MICACAYVLYSYIVSYEYEYEPEKNVPSNILKIENMKCLTLRARRHRCAAIVPRDETIANLTNDLQPRKRTIEGTECSECLQELKQNAHHITSICRNTIMMLCERKGIFIFMHTSAHIYICVCNVCGMYVYIYNIHTYNNVECLDGVSRCSLMHNSEFKSTWIVRHYNFCLSNPCLSRRNCNANEIAMKHDFRHIMGY